MSTGLSLLLAYLGPETIVPATSALAAAGGLLLTFGGWLTRPLRRGFRWLFGTRRGRQPQSFHRVQMQSQSEQTGRD